MIYDYVVIGAGVTGVTLCKKLKEHGGSITALELHCIQSVADYLLNAKITDKLAMGGMSYGGMYTLYIFFQSKVRIQRTRHCLRQP